MPSYATVKAYDSNDVGAPVLSGSVGAGISVLDAVLLTGYNIKAVQSIAIAAGVVTLTYASAHGYTVDQVLALSNANTTALNDEFRVVSVPSPTTLTFTAPTGVTSESSTTLSTKVAPLNWNKSFSGTNLACYVSNDPTSTKGVLMVDDANAQYLNVKMVEVATSVSSGFGGNYTNAGAWPAYYNWRKSFQTNATASAWRVFGDGKTFYLLVAWQWQSYAGTYEMYMFGDFQSYLQADPFNCMLQGNIVIPPTVPSYPNQNGYAEGVLAGNNGGWVLSTGACIMRNAFALPGGAPVSRATVGLVGAQGSESGYCTGNTLPNITGNLQLLDVYLQEQIGILRGRQRGTLFLPSWAADVILDNAVMDLLAGSAIKRVKFAKGGGGGNTANASTPRYAFDLYGPW